MVVIDPAKPVPPSLGSTRQICVQPGAEQLNRRYRLQSLAARLRPGERVSQCHRAIAPGAGAVTIMHSAADERAWYQQLVVCNRVWECPVCSARIAATRVDELNEAIGQARRLGLHPNLVTLTLQHHQSDELVDLVDALLSSVRAFKSGRGWADLRDEYDWRGDVRDLEVTYGENGWHPHCHLLIFTGIELDATTASGLRAWVAERWRSILARHDATASFTHGVDVQCGDEYLAQYLAKFGKTPEQHTWGLADELARSPSKRAHRDGLTPWGLLELYGMKPDDLALTEVAHLVKTPKRAGALFVTYADAMKGRSQLHWSRGLRDMLALAPEPVADEKIVDQAADAESIVTLGAQSWGRICKLEKRGELLAVAGAGGRAALVAWLALHGITVIDLSEFDTVKPPPPPADSPPAAPVLTIVQRSLFE